MNPDVIIKGLTERIFGGRDEPGSAVGVSSLISSANSRNEIVDPEFGTVSCRESEEKEIPSRYKSRWESMSFCIGVSGTRGIGIYLDSFVGQCCCTEFLQRRCGKKLKRYLTLFGDLLSLSQLDFVPLTVIEPEGIHPLKFLLCPRKARGRVLPATEKNYS
jgi:hypothetical protein